MNEIFERAPSRIKSDKRVSGSLTEFVDNGKGLPFFKSGISVVKKKVKPTVVTRTDEGFAFSES